MDPRKTHAEILDEIDLIDPIAYAKTRNHLSGVVTKLSPYITRGVITLPEIRDRLLAQHSYSDCEKLIQELAWREYFQKVYAAKGEAIFSDLRFSRTDWHHYELVSAVVNAQTGIRAIDTAVLQLVNTGYMHNHARMWTAMMSCNIAKAHWSTMSRWLYYHLLDGDLASNTLSWQWVAGTSVQKQYVVDQALINTCSNSVQRDTYLDVPRDTLTSLSTPSALVARESCVCSMSYPASDAVPDMTDATVLVYHPWSIDPTWRAGEKGIRIFILEPRLFDRFPISPLVCEHMLTLVRTHLPDASVYVGNIESLPGITAATVHSKAHPATAHFPGTKDAVPALFPDVTGYYQSFFKFWQACQQTNTSAA